MVSVAAVGSLDIRRSAYAAGSDVIKIGMIGCGGRNAGAAVQALEDSDLSARRAGDVECVTVGRGHEGGG